MPTLDQHQSNEYTKLLFIGDAKAGKTTALVSLVEAGYKLYILDMDNLLDSLVHQIRTRCPDKIRNVEFVTIRDKRKMSPLGPVIDGKPTAFISATKMLDRWKYTDDNGKEVDHGVPADWGPNCILVIDSLSRLCDASYDFHEAIIPKGRSGEADGRAIYGNAQDGVEGMLAAITSKGFETNVIVICHGTYMELPDKTTKIFPQGVGQKLSPKIPQYFPTYIRINNKGGRRTLQLKTDANIDLATPKPMDSDTLPADTGLATLFEMLREAPTVHKPKLVRKL